MYLSQVSSKGHRTQKLYDSVLIALPLSYPHVLHTERMLSGITISKLLRHLAISPTKNFAKCIPPLAKCIDNIARKYNGDVTLFSNRVTYYSTCYYFIK